MRLVRLAHPDALRPLVVLSAVRVVLVGGASVKRYTRDRPCPVCGGFERAPRGQGVRCVGFLTDDEVWARCTREEYAGGLARDDKTAVPTWVHLSRGPCLCGRQHAPADPGHDRRGRERRWTIRDIDGKPLAVHVRIDPPGEEKHVWWTRPNGQKGLGGLRPIEFLYGIEELRTALGMPLLLVEGEPAADAARAALGHGWVVLGTVCGASSTPSRETLARLKSASHVTLWPDADADAQGLHHMERMGAILQDLGLELSQIEPPDGVRDGWDAANATPDQVRELVAAARPWTGSEANGHVGNGQVAPEVAAELIDGPIPADQVVATLADRILQVDTAPALPDEVWLGWLDHFRSWITPTTDAPHESIFSAGIVLLGIALGRQVAVSYGRPLYPNAFCLNIGPPGSTRKSTMLHRQGLVLRATFTHDPERPFLKVLASLASAPGLGEAFCREKEAGGRTVLQEIPDLRVLLALDEFTATLQRMQQPATSSIRELLCAMYYGERFDNPTRHRPFLVERPHLSINAATTPGALASRLMESDITSGLLPRFHTFVVHQRERLAFPQTPDELVLKEVAKDLQEIIAHAASLKAGGSEAIIPLTLDAQSAWTDIDAHFQDAKMGVPEIVAYMLERVPERTLKLALMYAMMAKRKVIEREDLEVAALFGQHQVATAPLICGTAGQHPLSQEQARVLAAVKGAYPKWVTPNAIHDFVSGRISAGVMVETLDSLVALRRIEERSPDDPEVAEYRRRGPGRPPRGFYRWVS